jgi:hypothetical protein
MSEPEADAKGQVIAEALVSAEAVRAPSGAFSVRIKGAAGQAGSRGRQTK